MGAKEIIKKGVLDSFSMGTEMTFWRMLAIFIVACVIGIYIFMIYKNFSKAEFYSKDLNITMAGMTITVTAIMIAMQTNLIVSLGMVGALSIVRFRTAVKNPMDLLYLFWAISSGIICGVGLFVLAILLCIIMTVLLFVLGQIPNNKAPLLLIIHATNELDSENIKSVLEEKCSYYKQKSFIVRNNSKELMYELKTKSLETMVEQIQQIDGISFVNCLEHEGELRI